MFDGIYDDIVEEEESQASEEAVEEENEEESQEEESTEEESEDSEEAEEKEEEKPEDEEEKEDEDEDEVDEDEDEEETSEKELDKEEEIEYTLTGKESRTITVDGEETEVTVDEAFDRYQRKEASDRRFKEGAEAKKEAETFWENIYREPGETLVDRVCDEICDGDRVKARAIVVQNLLEWMAPECEAYNLEDEKERELATKMHELDVRTKETERQEARRLAKLEQQANEEFDNNIRAGILKGCQDNDLPIEDKIWKAAIKNLKAYQEELPSYLQDDIRALRKELVQYAEKAVAQVARDRAEAIKNLVPKDLSLDDLKKHNPKLVAELKKERVRKAKEKRSQKRKGNAAKKLEQKKKVKSRKSAPRYISTEEAFDFSED
jgi:hypothetical protein